MATIENRGNNKYRIIISNGYNKDGTQIRKRKSITLPEGLTPRQAEKELQRQAILFEEEVKRGTYLDGEKITFAELADMWMEKYASKELTPGTLKNHRMRLQERIIPAIGHLKISKIQPHHLSDFYDNLSEEGIVLNKYYLPKKIVIDTLIDERIKALDVGVNPRTFNRLKNGERTSKKTADVICKYLNIEFKQAFIIENTNDKLSGKTIHHHHSLKSSILTYAVEENILLNNPARRVKTPKYKKTKVKYYNDEDIAKMFVALEDEPLKYKACIYLAIDTGLRLSEAAGLFWSDIDFDKNLLTINKQRQYVSGIGIFDGTTKTESGIRKVTISPSVIQILKKLKSKQSADRFKIGSAWIQSNRVFVHEDGKPMFPSRSSEWFSIFLEKYDLPKITFHQLRHTNASIMIAEGVDLVTLAGRLGHSDKNTTLRTYAHIIEDAEERAANKMEDFYKRINGSN